MARIVASDLSEPMLAVAKAEDSRRTVEWRQADAGSLPFDDASFVVVVCQFGVMFLGPFRTRGIAAQAELVWQNVFAALKAGGMKPEDLARPPPILRTARTWQSM